jgi:RNA polymerase sigma-70 factor (ECF subfamily)
VNDGPLGEEIVQDAFMQVWRRAATYKTNSGGNARAWLLTIVHHRAIDMVRRPGGSRPPDVSLDEASNLTATSDVWRDVSARLTRDEVRAAVGALPPEQREAIELAYFQGLSHSEIADRLHTPLGTIKGRMRLGLKKLYDALTEAEGVSSGGLHGA